MRILILYSELAGYVNSCIDAFVRLTNAEVTIIHWKVNAQAPYEFNARKGVTEIEKERYAGKKELLAACKEYHPDTVLISGWIDKDYLLVGRHFRKQGIPVVMVSDTQWKGHLRQHIASLVSRFFLHRIFSHAWVTGLEQFEYARRLGFSIEKISLGVYSADQPAFHASFLHGRPRKKEKYPRTFLYVGRLVPEKGISHLYDAFKSIPSAERNGWTLTLIGAGPLESTLEKSEGIQILPFVQPDRLPAIIAGYGCFVMPSLKEPWGVVAHECAAAGLPLLLSSSVGAAASFLRDGYNGHLFSAGNTESLKDALLKVIRLDDEQLLIMGDRSATISMYSTPDLWAGTLLSICRTQRDAKPH